MKSYRFASAVSTVGSALVGLFLGISSGWLVALFAGDDVNMLATGTLSIRLQCLPIVYPMAGIWGADGVAATQALADTLTLILAIPIIRSMKRKIRAVAELQESEIGAL